MIKEKALVTLKNDIEVEYPFADDLPMIFLGEISNMPEHGIFALSSISSQVKGYAIK